MRGLTEEVPSGGAELALASALIGAQVPHCMPGVEQTGLTGALLFLSHASLCQAPRNGYKKQGLQFATSAIIYYQARTVRWTA